VPSAKARHRWVSLAGRYPEELAPRAVIAVAEC
jgi:hypothetical protein